MVYKLGLLPAVIIEINRCLIMSLNSAVVAVLFLMFFSNGFRIESRIGHLFFKPTPAQIVFNPLLTGYY